MYVHRIPGRVTSLCRLCIRVGGGPRERAVKRLVPCADRTQVRSGGGAQTELLRPCEPAEWIAQFLNRGHRLGRGPDPVEAVDARPCDDAVAEGLALLVLAQLEVHAEQAVQQFQEPGAVMA